MMLWGRQKDDNLAGQWLSAPTLPFQFYNNRIKISFNADTAGRKKKGLKIVDQRFLGSNTNLPTAQFAQYAVCEQANDFSFFILL